MLGWSGRIPGDLLTGTAVLSSAMALRSSMLVRRQRGRRCERPRFPGSIDSAAAAAADLVFAFDLDVLLVLLADLAADLLLLGDGLLAKPNPFLGHRPLLDHRLLLMQDDLVLLLGDLRPAGGGIEVGVGDRLAFDPHLLALHRPHVKVQGVTVGQLHHLGRPASGNPVGSVGNDSAGIGESGAVGCCMITPSGGASDAPAIRQWPSTEVVGGRDARQVQAGHPRLEPNPLSWNRHRCPQRRRRAVPLAAKVGSLATGAALAVGIAAAVVLFGLHLLYQQREPRP
jgi:hypothetical protein